MCLVVPHLVCQLRWSYCGPCKDFVEEFLQVADSMVIACVHHVPCISAVGHTSRFGHADRPCMYERHMLGLVHLRLQVVHEDHFQEVSSEQSSVGLIVITGPLEHVKCHTGGIWPTSTCGVHCDHVSCMGVKAYVLARRLVRRVWTVRATSFELVM